MESKARLDEYERNMEETNVSLELIECNNSPDDKAVVNRPPLFLSKRLLVAIMLLVCFINFQVLRNSMNIAIVEMTSNKSLIEKNITIFKPPEYSWDTKTIGVVISILGYGGMFAFLGGFLTTLLGGAVNSAICMFLSGITTMLHPIALYYNFYAFLVCRFLTGALEVSTSDISVRWFPKRERSRLMSFSFNGTNIGASVVYPICGYLAHTWGWQVVFYVTGIITVISSVTLFLTVKNSPTEDKRLSKKELAFILEDTDINTNKENPASEKIPVGFLYKSIFTSLPVWGLLINQFTYLWIVTILGACLPLYAKDFTQKNTGEIGLLSSIPNIVYTFIVPIAATIMDYWSNRSNLTRTQINKILLSSSCFLAGFFFIAIILFSDFIASLVCIVCIQVVTVFIPLVLILDMVSIAPDHSSHISGLSTLFFFAGSIVAQTLTGFMTTNHSLSQWNNCYLLAAGIAFFGGVTYILFGATEQQPWSKITKEEDPEHENINPETISK